MLTMLLNGVNNEKIGSGMLIIVEKNQLQLELSVLFALHF